MFVVLDTNSWIQTRLLGTSVASALIYKLASENNHLVLSDAQRRELEVTATRKLSEHEKTARSNLEAIKQYMGEIENVSYPTGVQVKQRISERLSELGDVYIEVICSDSQKLSAADRVIEQSPPNAPQDQQYKDSLIWESILGLADDDDVVFITKDGGFFEDRDFSKGLAANLAREIESKKHSVKVHKEIGDYLSREKLREPDQANIADSILSYLQSGPADHFQFGTLEFLDPSLDSFQVKAFLTEKPGVLAIDFDLILHSNALVDHEKGSEIEGHLNVLGTATWNEQRSRIVGVSVDQTKIISPEGLGSRVYTYAYASNRRPKDRNLIRKPFEE